MFAETTCESTNTESMKTVLFCGFFLFVCTNTLCAQKLVRSTISSLGNSNTNDGLYLSQTGGQASMHTSVVNTSNELRQGFQQALFSRIDNNLNSELTIYPNPTNGSFLFIMNLEKTEAYFLTLTDSNGKGIFEKNGISNEQEFIQLPESIVAGIYYIKVITASGKTLTNKFIVIP